MIAYFRETGSRKLLKELNLDIMPSVKDHVKIGAKTYFVTCAVFDTNTITYTIWLHKI